MNLSKRVNLRLTLLGFLCILTILTLSACGGGSDGDGGDSCDMVANSDGPAYFKVKNHLNSALQWKFVDSYPFGAYMQPGECVNMGVDVSQYSVELRQCNINDEECRSGFGPLKTIIFAVDQGETYTLEVDSAFFN